MFRCIQRIRDYVTHPQGRVFRFARLRQAELTDAENHAIYGANANPNGHGHNYVLEVTVEGEPDPVTGMVFDLRELKLILNEQVVEPMDHRFLNREVPPFDHVVPTTENLAIEIWKRIEPLIDRKNVSLRNVRLYETQDLFVDCGRSS